MKPFTVVGLALAAALLVLAVMNARSKPAQTAARPPVASQNAQRPRSFYPPPRSGEAGADGAPTTRRAFAARRTRRVAGGTVGATPPASGQLPTGEPQPDPNAADDEMEPIVPLEIARVALSFVGQDPDAEDAWVEAINDPALSPEDRQNLIEDLNEEGFPDPKNITPDDLPLILGRLELIEELGPDAMDEVNADAFAEAYKDLNNMLEKIDAQLRAEEEQDAQEAAAAAAAEVNPSVDTWSVHQRYARRISARR